MTRRNSGLNEKLETTEANLLGGGTREVRKQPTKKKVPWRSLWWMSSLQRRILLFVKKKKNHQLLPPRSTRRTFYLRRPLRQAMLTPLLPRGGITAIELLSWRKSWFGWWWTHESLEEVKRDEKKWVWEGFVRFCVRRSSFGTREIWKQSTQKKRSLRARTHTATAHSTPPWGSQHLAPRRWKLTSLTSLFSMNYLMLWRCICCVPLLQK